MNPWALRCLERAERPSDEPVPCILLENLTRQFAHPCCLDIKMGTRQHALDASIRKRERAMAKCNDTTSSALGLRVCGLQVYDPVQGVYKCQDKYAGRALTPEQVPQTLEQFFVLNCGSLDSPRCQHVLAALIAKLERLETAVESLVGYRFIASSLLLLYDGSPSSVPPK